MKTAEVGVRISLQNILYVTDFSHPSETALPFVLAIARDYGSKIFALHVLMLDVAAYTAPEFAVEAIAGQEEFARAEMCRIEGRLYSAPCETLIERGDAVWPPIKRAMKKYDINLVVLGTHGRTGVRKLILGSVAEEIFRQSAVPVLTIGPRVQSDDHVVKFECVLFATDFTAESLTALPYAVSLAQENQARLLLLRVVPESEKQPPDSKAEFSAANVMHNLSSLIPKEAELWCRPEALIEYGDPATRIIETAKQRGADLIVLGVRAHSGRLGAATHLERAVAHNVVVQASCPVLTVRG